MGLAATDGRLIRPKDEPTTAKVAFDWCDVLNEGLVRNVELRQQKWIVKRRELELIAAKNFLLPKLDFVAQYRWLGLGNDCSPWPTARAPTSPQPDSNAYPSLTSGQFQEWQLGFQLNMPLGFRREMAGVRNAQLMLTRERTKLQEGEVGALAPVGLRHPRPGDQLRVEPDRTSTAASPPNARSRPSPRPTKPAPSPSTALLEAQQTLAQAESDYYRSLVDYNKSIAQVHFRKGSLLEYNGVYLAEGPWPGKAYFDARRRARARDAATYLDYGFTQPRVISRGPIEQHADGGGGAGGRADGRHGGPGRPTRLSRRCAHARAASRLPRAGRSQAGHDLGAGRAAGSRLRPAAGLEQWLERSRTAGRGQRTKHGRWAGDRHRLDDRGKGQLP